MSLKQKNREPIPIAVRLTLWYAGIFTVSSLIAFTIFYFAMAAIIYDRTDADLVEDIDELALLLQQQGEISLREEFNDEAETDGSDKVFYRLIDSDNRQQLATNLSHWPGLIPARDLRKQLSQRNTPLLETMQFNGHPYPARIVSGNIGGGKILQAGRSFEDDDELLHSFRNIFAVTLPVIMVIAGLFGWFMARKALQGVRQVTAAAIAITQGDLNRRVPETGRGDEIDLLANTFNAMLDRIQALITGMKDMTDNIAHDLRSPLTRIRGIAETTLLNDPSVGDLQSIAGNTIEECDRLLHMINTMLDITETEAGTVKRTMTAVDMTAIVKDACELFQTLADDKSVTLKCSHVADAQVHGSVQHLQRLVGNLLENALKYTPPGGAVTLSLYKQSDSVVVDISDNGIGIADTDIDNVFKRFYRCDQSRSQTGTGLGLSLALSIARAHSGNITVSSSPGQGSIFSIILPQLK